MIKGLLTGLLAMSCSLASATESLSDRAQDITESLKNTEKSISRQDAQDLDMYMNRIERILRDYDRPLKK